MSGGFEPLAPRNLGDVVDATPKAEERALDLVGQHIKELERALDLQRKLTAKLAHTVLDLLQPLRAVAKSKGDDISETRLAQLGEQVKKLI